MKPKLLIMMLLITFTVAPRCYGVKKTDSTQIQMVLKSLERELLITTKSYSLEYRTLYLALKEVNQNLKTQHDSKVLVQLLLEKDWIKDQLENLQQNQAINISKIRYLKGLEIIKLIFEKTLALDHHFSSVSTFNEISKMSNPNSYPEFSNVKQLLKSKNDKKIGFDLSGLLSENIYTSVIHSFVSIFASNGNSKQEKEERLKEVECILDFTLRMHNDLNTIYFETTFLEHSNQNIIKDLNQLFVDYTKPIGYATTLKQCRATDDWDQVKRSLEAYLETLTSLVNQSSDQEKITRMQIDLEFPIDRLLAFIDAYNNFIDQGEKFYQKFAIMLDTYQTEAHCKSQLPSEFLSLKQNIATSIEKFNTAYKPVEINGSKLKEVLYGINTFN